MADPDMVDRAGRDPAAFHAAVLAVASGRYGHTASPRRLLEAGPWWADAHGVPRSPETPDRPTVTDAEARLRCRSCDPAGWIVDPDTDLPRSRCTHAEVYAAVAA